MKTILLILLSLSIFSCNYEKKPSQQNKGYFVEIDYGEYEDSVVVNNEETSLSKDSNGMVILAFQSDDLIYKIRVFPKLIEYLRKDQKYKFVWKRYQINKKENKIGDNRPNTIDLHCWKNVVDSFGKEVILSGDETLQKNSSDPECMVDVTILERNTST